MGARDLPDMYALAPRGSGIHIRQGPRAHVTTITCISPSHGLNTKEVKHHIHKQQRNDSRLSLFASQTAVA